MTPLLITLGILVPFFGTALGSAALWLFPKSGGKTSQKSFYGFAAGVMLASLVWSLLIPSLDYGKTPLPTISGFLLGMGFFLLCDALLGRLPLGGRDRLVFAVTLHNLPEGMAVGVACAAALGGAKGAMESALVLAIGIALQNFPEGAIISTPLAATGKSKGRAFLTGVASGAVEPVGAVAALVLTRFVSALLPFVLSFAAGAMLYVVADELIPAITKGEGKERGLAFLAIGFALMMTMDVMLG